MNTPNDQYLETPYFSIGKWEFFWPSIKKLVFAKELRKTYLMFVVFVALGSIAVILPRLLSAQGQIFDQLIIKGIWTFISSLMVMFGVFVGTVSIFLAIKFARTKNILNPPRFKVEISPDGLCIFQDAEKNTIFWNEITKIENNEDFIAFWLSDTGIFNIPKRIFDNEKAANIFARNAVSFSKLSKSV